MDGTIKTELKTIEEEMNAAWQAAYDAAIGKGLTEEEATEEANNNSTVQRYSELKDEMV